MEQGITRYISSSRLTFDSQNQPWAQVGIFLGVLRELAGSWS